jgi:hypothetical protein
VETDHVRTNRGILDLCEHRAFDDGHLAQWLPFDFEAVEISLGEVREDQPEDAAAETLAGNFREIWNPPGDLRRAKRNFDTLSRRALREPATTRGAEAFKKLVAYCTSTRREAPWRRFVAITATVFPDMLAAKNGPTLARELGMTKANFSKQACNFRKAFGWHFHPWRSEVGRERMRQARLAQREPGSATAYSRKGKKAPTISTHPLRLNAPSVNQERPF